MTVSSTAVSVVYTGNGVTTAFPVTIQFFEIEVVLIVDGVETVQEEGTHYTVTGGNGATGTVTMLSPPTTDPGGMVINRKTSRLQQTDYTENDPFPAETHEKALDRLTMQMQEVWAALADGTLDFNEIGNSDDITEGSTNKFVRHFSNITGPGDWQGGVGYRYGVKIGQYAGPSVSEDVGDGVGYVIIGDGAAVKATNARGSIIIGAGAAGNTETPGFATLAIGDLALANVNAASFATSETNGTRNLGIGTLAGHFTTTGWGNTFIARNAGHSNISGHGRIHIGYLAGAGHNPIGLSGDIENHTPLHNGDQDIIIGYNAGRYAGGTVGSNKVVILGALAAQNVKGGWNTILGAHSGQMLDSGLWYGDRTVNTIGATGTYSQSGTTITVNVTSHGAVATRVVSVKFTSGALNAVTAEDLFLTVATVTDANTFTIESSESLTASGDITVNWAETSSSGNSSNFNVVVGYEAGLNVLRANRSVIIGAAAGSNDTFVGGTSLLNRLVVGTQAAGRPLIAGDFANGYLAINGVNADLADFLSVHDRTAGTKFFSINTSGVATVSNAQAVVAVLQSSGTDAKLALVGSGTSGVDHVSIGALGDELLFRAGNGLRARVTGFTTAAGTANKDASGINVGTITASDANIRALAAWVKSIHDALATHGAIGA